jgi:GLPGLI family protein
MVLRIGRKFSSFYSYNKAIIDSIVASGNADAIMSDISKYKFGVSYRIFKDKAEDKIIYTDALGPANYKYEEPVPKFGWEIKSDTLRILGYICHMATCDFRGRKYTVWYCPSIPLPEGPWKFCGLPGLIFKVSDNNGDYIFSISGIKKVCKPITSEKKQYIKTTLAKYLKTYRRYNENPIAFMRASGVKIIVKNMDGTQYEAKVRKMKYDFIEKEIK